VRGKRKNIEWEVQDSRPPRFRVLQIGVEAVLDGPALPIATEAAVP
jgi:hypothetical protein